MRRAVEKYNEKNVVFHQKTIQNRVQNMSQTKHAIKIAQKTVPGTLCGSTGRFWVDFGPPAGSQNRPKMGQEKAPKNDEKKDEQPH